MTITGEDIVGEIVASDYKAALIFKNHGIDFCCRGNRSIKEVCDTNNLDVNQIIGSLETVMNAKSGTSTDYQSWPIDLLVDYVEKKHHAYVESKITEIRPYLAKIVKVHGNDHPELLQIEDLFNKSAGELTSHMKKEELIIFPFIRKLVEAQKSTLKIDLPHFNTIENPVAMMKKDHDNEGIRFRKIAELSKDYTTPSHACNTYKVTYALLKEFEEDLHLHIHLENNILFPEAIRLEKLYVN